MMYVTCGYIKEQNSLSMEHNSIKALSFIIKTLSMITL